MSEDQTTYNVSPEESQEAMDMLGVGYDQPTVVIEPPRKTQERKRGGEFTEKNNPAWIKFSTAFKLELPEIDGNALKVWIFIALSVDYKGEAFPGIQTIAKAIKLSHTTVIAHIHSLEALGLLTVRRGERRVNIYQIADDYVKIGVGEPVKKLESSDPNSKETVLNSKENPPTSKAGLNPTRVNKNEQEKSTASISIDLEQSDISWSLAGGKPVTQKQLDRAREIDDFENMIDKQFARFPLKWAGFRGTEQDGFRAFLKHPDQAGQPLEQFVDWWMQDEWRMSRPPANLNKIMTMYPQAFADTKPAVKYNHAQTDLEKTIESGDWTPAPKRNHA